jgi:hypothetical protein
LTTMTNLMSELIYSIKIIRFFYPQT